MKLSRLRNIYKHIDYYVVPSLFTREKLIQGGFPPDRIVHIPTFIDMPETFSNSTVEAKDILYVGRFSPEKGVNILVEAFSKIKNKSARLLLAGGTKEEYEAVMGDTLPASLEGKVKFLGFLSLNKVYELFASCAFFVVPSIWYENQPNSVLEGMRFGKPALVSKLGSLQEMVVEGDTGFLFEPGNSDDLADKMDHLLADPESMGRIGQNAFNYVKKYHSKEDHLARLNELFLKCTENSKI
jgi:glycosyltransferase involved in cell wall biosynthesis